MNTFPDTLVKGYQAFRAGGFADQRERYATLAENGQKPHTLVIACCDSRSAPETIFNAGPGDLFVVRNVANLVPPYDADDGFFSTSAAMEFSVISLKVRNIMVMGHAGCGGVSAALNPDMEPLSPSNFVGRWIELLDPAARSIVDNQTLSAKERQTALEQSSVRQSIENLRSYPYISELENAGKLTLCGSWFDISRGELWTMDADTGNFLPAPMDAEN